MFLTRFLVVVILLSLSGLTMGQTINTYAGGGGLIFGGDGGSATDASLDWPSGIAVDANGNLYIADFWNKRVRKVDRVTGIITTIAGNGSPAHDGDGGLATAAGINYPLALTFDRAGNLYIAADSIRFRSAMDYVNEGAYVRKVARSGIISTVAGNGTIGYSGDGGPATAAGFDQIWGMAADPAGNVVLTGMTYRLRRIDAVTGIINTIAGNGTFAYSGDGGPATAAAIGYAQDVAVDRNGSIFISAGGRIRKIDTAGIIATVAGDSVFADGGDGGPATASHLYASLGIAADWKGNIYFSQADHVVRKIDTAGMITRFAGNGTNGGAGDGGSPDSAQLSMAEGVAADTFGNVYISDVALMNIRVVCNACSRVGESPLTGSDGKLELWPQPCNRNFTLLFKSPKRERINVTIVTETGSRVKEMNGWSNEEIEAGLNVPPGTYVLSIFSETGVQTKQLLTVQ